MQTTAWFRRFIISLILVIMLGMESSTRLDAQTQVLFLRLNTITQEDIISSQHELESVRTCWKVTVFVQEWVTVLDRNMIHNRSWKNTEDVRYRYFTIVGMLLLILVFCGLNGRKIKLYDNRYIWRRYYHILYIQKSDGRKKIAVSR